MLLEIGHKHLTQMDQEPHMKLTLPKQKRLSQHKKHKKKPMLLLSLIFIALPLVKPRLSKIKLLKLELVKLQEKFHTPEILGAGN
jgi:uncharacterized membrane protein